MHVLPELWIDLSQELSGLHFISFTLDYAKRLFVLATKQDVNYQNGIFPRLRADTPHDFVVIEATADYTTSYTIKNQYWNYHTVQPLPEDELLLTCARSAYRSHDDFDRNACVFTHDGKLKREFLLGDGIEDIQTTGDGTIWTSYFDEGVFGNFGWNDPVGAPGLIQWDRFGNKLKTFQPTGGLDTICDCYAMNIVSKTESWIYYYTEFPLVKLVNGMVADFWNSPIRGSHSFAIWRDYVLFCGSYDDRLLHLYQLGNHHKMTHIADYELPDPADQIIARSNHIVIRRKHIFRRKHTFQLLNLAEVVKAI